MFQGLSERLGAVLDGLRRQAALSEADVAAAMREVRVALLEADVALPVVKDFIAKAKEKAVGQQVLRSVTPGQMVIKIVHDELVAMLGQDDPTINLKSEPPSPILMVGLQGSGKTTSSGKIAKRFQDKQRKKVLMASLDIYRPAAQQQLKVLGEQAGVDTLPVIFGERPVAIAKRALTVGRLQGYDVILLDTAGRLHIDEKLMTEVAEVRDAVNPVETLLVADSMTGQDAVTVAKAFHEQIGLTGIVLTRVDGDARGGAALSMRAVTGRPIKVLGVGEKLEDIEDFHADRIAGRILGMGDVVSLVEKAAETVDREEAEKLARKMQKGIFDLEDMLSQLKQMRLMGGANKMMGLIPGVGKLKKQMGESQLDERALDHQEAIILSMTPKERRNVKLLNASRKRRIARGAGMTVQDVNKVLKQHQQMSKAMKQMSKLGKKGVMRHGMKGLLGQ